MFLLTPAIRGSLSNATTGASHAPTVNAAVPVGRVLIVRAISTSEPTVLTAGATNHHTGVTDTVGNTYTKIGEVTKDGNGSNISVAISMWFTKVTTEIPNGSAITVAYDATYKSRLTGLVEYTLEVPESTVALAGVAVAHGTGSPLSVPLTLGEENEYTWLGCGGYGNRNYVITKDASFTNDLTEIEVDNGNFDSCTLWGQYRAVQVDTQTWANTTPTGSIRWGMILGALTVTPPAPPAPEEGTREYQDDFETDSHAVDRVSTTRRPDAVSLDYRTAYTIGPTALEDPSAGLSVRVWRVRADVNAVYLARANDANTAFEPEILLTTAAGLTPIDELDVAFDEYGRIVVVAERATGSGGAAQISLYWYNPSGITPGYEWKNVGTGRTPRCVCDCFPTTVAGVNVCPPDIDVHLFYVKSTGAVVRIEQSSGYATEVATPIPSSSFVRLQKAFRTDDRRVSLLYDQHNIVTGRHQLRRVDSVIYRDSLLTRPTFENYSSPFNDVMQAGYLAWSTPDDSLTTDNWHVRVSTSQQVDAIELETRKWFPYGSGDGAIWDPHSEYAPGGGIGPGFFADFSVAIHHGFNNELTKGWMDPCSFRARTRKVVDEQTCYSPWRYTIVAPSYPLVGGRATMDPQYFDDLVHCDRDAHLDLPNRVAHYMRSGLVEGVRTSQLSARNDDRPFVCGESVVALPLDYWFVGGERNFDPSYPFPTHKQHFHLRRRAFVNIDFTDDDGRYLVDIIGPVLETTTSGIPPTELYAWPETAFPRQFPEDDGSIIPTPTNIHILLVKPDVLPWELE